MALPIKCVVELNSVLQNMQFAQVSSPTRGFNQPLNAGLIPTAFCIFVHSFDWDMMSC